MLNGGADGFHLVWFLAFDTDGIHGRSSLGTDPPWRGWADDRAWDGCETTVGRVGQAGTSGRGNVKNNVDEL